jgi:glycosyltransferase involved in cell wall biosynthesis
MGKVLGNVFAGVTATSTDFVQQPLLTVAMPVFNGGSTLRAALLSIASQTFTDWELLLIDDGSTDGAIAGVADIDDSRIRVISDGQNRGLAARLNEAIGLAKGVFFARMDHDDISHPERFAIQIESLKNDPSLDLVGAHCLAISEANEILGVLPKASSHEDICARPWLGFYLPHPTWMGRIEWFREHRYASPGPYCCEDQELLLRTHAVSHFHVLPQLLLAYRVRDRLSWKKAWRTRTTLYGLQRRYFNRKRQYFWGLLAAMAVAARLGFDSLRMLKQSVVGQRVRRTIPLGMSAAEVDVWRRLIGQLKSGQSTR